MKTVIFDLDGTLALIDHRRHLVEGENKQWDAFYEACDQDLPNAAVITMNNELFMSQFNDYRIVIFSGRSVSVHEKTLRWLTQHQVYFHLLKMRPEKDYQPDEELKRKWLAEIGKENVLCVFDDRKKVVDMWRAEGVPCFQVAEANF